MAAVAGFHKPPKRPGRARDVWLSYVFVELQGCAVDNAAGDGARRRVRRTVANLHRLKHERPVRDDRMSMLTTRKATIMNAKSNPAGNGPAELLRHELENLHREWWCFVLLGALFAGLGTVAIFTPLLASLAAATLFGVLMLVGGVAQVVSAFWAGHWRGFTLYLLGGILYLVVGGLIVGNPFEGLEVLTLLLAAFFIVGGVFRIVVGLQTRMHQWGWLLLSGLVSLMLGILIWAQFPESALWVIGLFIGLEMVFNGVVWVMLGLELRTVQPPEA